MRPGVPDSANRSIGPIAASKPIATTMSMPGIVMSRFVSTLAKASRANSRSRTRRSSVSRSYSRKCLSIASFSSNR